MDKSTYVTVFIVIVFCIFLREGYLTMEYSLEKRRNSPPPLNFTSLELSTSTKHEVITEVPNSLTSIDQGNTQKGSNSKPAAANAYKKGNSTKLNAYERMLLTKKTLREEYVNVMAKQQNEETDPNNKDTKYVVFRPVEAGFGNSMITLVESILLAFFTNRHFYMSEFEVFDVYFTLPFNNYHIKSSEIPKDDAIIIGDSCEYRESDLLNSTKKYIVMGSSCKLIDYVIYSDDYIPTFREHGFILYEKGNFNMELRRVLFNWLYTQVVRVRPFVLEEVERVKKELKWDDYTMISMHIRSGRIKKDEMINFFLNHDDTRYFTLKAREITAEYEKEGSKPVRWYIASDNERVKRDFYYANRDRVLTYKCNIEHSALEMRNSRKSDGMLCTLVDAYLIASAKKAIITLRSTYGIWATLQNLDVKRVPVRKGELMNYLRNNKKL